MIDRNKLIIIALGMILVFNFLFCSKKEQNIVASVNESQITVSDFRNELGIYHLDKTSTENKSNSVKYFEIKKEILNSMIRDKILVDEAQRTNISVSSDEVAKEIKTIQEDYPGDTFMQYLRERGINYDYWKSKVKNSILIKKLNNLITKETPSLSESEIFEYYNKNNNAFTVPEQVHAYQIVVKTEEEAYKIYNELKSGKKFEDLAKSYSITPEGKLGGDLGFFSRGSMPEAFDDVLFRLGQGKISKVISSEYGYHILKVADKKPSTLKPLQEVRDQIVETLIRMKKDETFSEWFKEKIAKAKIKRNNVLLASIK